MHQTHESYAHQFMTNARQADRCEWCARRKPKNRRGFCRHWDVLRRKIETFGKLPRCNLALDRELRIARAEKEDCIAWGKILNGILSQVTPLDLEHWFRMLAKRIATQERLYANPATMLGWTFSPEQRQVLAYILWEIFGEHASRNRKGRVIGAAMRQR